jgi:hypothetical protein
MVAVGLAGEATPQADEAEINKKTKTMTGIRRNKILTRMNLSSAPF